MKLTRTRPALISLAVVGMLLLAGFPSAAVAQARDEAPADPKAKPAQPAAADLKATVLAVTGLVRARDAADQPWKKVEPGAVLGMGAEFRTGLRSAVRFAIPPDQVITLDRLGTIKLITAVQRADGKVTTDLGMKYGRTRYQIEAGGVEYVTSVSSPSAVLAVKGSDVTFNDDALGAYAFGSGHLAFMDTINRRMVKFGRRTVAAVSADDSSAAAHARKRTTDADPRGAFGGRDEVEKAILAQYLAQGGVDNKSFQFVKRLVGEKSFAGSLQITGSLFFVLNWAAGFPSTDLDLRVTSPAGDTITSANTAAHPTITGGVFDANGDQRAGFFPPDAPNATESAGWLVAGPHGSFPPGRHKIAAVLKPGGAMPPFAMLTVFRDFVPGAPTFLTLDREISVDGVVKQAAVIEIDVK